MKNLFFISCFLAVTCVTSVSAFAGMIYDFKIFNNRAYENDPRLVFTLTITDEGFVSGKQKVGFTFNNSSIVTSSITDIYFDAYPDSGLLKTSNVAILNGQGVFFSKGASPKTLPGGAGLVPKFDKTPEYSADSDSPVSLKGINPGEWLKLIFTLEANKSYNDVIEQISNGGSFCQPNLRIGIHIQSLPDRCNDSASAINCTQPVSEPATITLLSFSLLALRKKKR